MNIGNKIHELRERRGITQEQLSAALGVSPQAVSKWETSQCCPDISLLPVIAGYFGVSIDTLFEYDADRLAAVSTRITPSISGTNPSARKRFFSTGSRDTRPPTS